MRKMKFFVNLLGTIVCALFGADLGVLMAAATNLPDALTVKGTPTGIKTIQATDAKTDNAYYNLSGQRVSADFKGIVIHNGKKILKK